MKKSGFQFTDPHIVKLEFEVNEGFAEDKFQGFEIKSEVSQAVIKENEEAFVKLCIFIGERNETSPFYCNVDMMAKFKAEETCAPDFFQKLLKANAPALLLSYARPIVSIVVAQAGFPEFNIPFINFVEN